MEGDKRKITCGLLLYKVLKEKANYYFWGIVRTVFFFILSYYTFYIFSSYVYNFDYLDFILIASVRTQNRFLYHNLTILDAEILLSASVVRKMGLCNFSRLFWCAIFDPLGM